MSELLDWVERAAEANFAACEKTQEILAREATATFGWLVAGAAAALSFAVRPEALGGPQLVLVVLAVWLAGCASVLVWRAMMFGDFPAPANEPRNLYQPDYDLAALREVELENLQARIDDANGINMRRSLWVNRVRAAAAVGVLLAGCAVVWWWASSAAAV